MRQLGADKDWLTFGEDAVPLRDCSTRQAEEERTERLRLMTAGDQRATQGVVFFLALFTIGVVVVAVLQF